MIVRRVLSVSLLAVATTSHVSAQESPLEALIREGVEANSDLAARRTASEQDEARWDASRTGRLPVLSLEARYSLAEGGRTFDVPVGDLVNPVYTTLNDLLGESRFSEIGNQRFPFLRDREQDTHLRVSQVLWNPSINADVRSKRSMVEAGRAGLEAATRGLTRDIRIAYYRYANAVRAESVLDAALELMIENERARTRSWQASVVTLDAVHRARAERLDVQVDLERARADRRRAASYLNYLGGRDAQAEIELSPEDLSLPSWAAADTAGATRALPVDHWIEELAAVATTERPELRQLEHAIIAAEAALDAARGALRPSVALAVDGGIQGRGYGVGRDERYVLASVLVSWNLTSWGAESRRVQEARLEHARLRHERDDALARVRLELETAALSAQVAMANLPALAQRVEAAEAAFRLVVRRRDEGMATPLEFLDARSSLTRAQLEHGVGETTVLIHLAELAFAAGGDEGLMASAFRSARRGGR